MREIANDLPSGRIKGRYDIEPTAWGMARALAGGIWDGMRLRCPSCGKAPLFRKGFQIHSHCPRCGAAFERPGEGDFVGAVVTAYAITAVIFATAVILLRAVEPNVGVRLWLAAPIALIFVVAFYRNMKGIWVAILIGLVKWIR